MKTDALGLGLWLALSLTPGSTQAAAADRCQGDSICRERVAAAIQLAGKGRYEEALLLYESAYEQSHESRLLLNIGRCYYRLNQAQKALDYYGQFHSAQPEPEPELASRYAQFVAEAKLALLSQKTAGSGTSPAATGAASGAAAATGDSEPPPAPLITQPAADPPRRSTLFGRPTWRVALGVSTAGVGGVLVGLGIGALAVNETCVSPSMAFEMQCATELRSDGQRRALLLDGLTPGIPLLVGGGLLLVGGIVLAAWPARPPAGRAPRRAATTALARAAL